MSKKFARNSWLLLLTAIAVITVGCLGGGSKRDPVTHTVTVEVEGEGTVEPIKTHKVNDGATVDFKAQPKEDWEFEKWIVNGEEKTDSEFSLVVKKDLTAIAVFKEITEEPIQIEDPPPTEDPKTFTLTINQDGEGTVAPHLGDHEFDPDTKVQLEAIPAENWEFDKWVVEGVESYKAEMIVVMVQDVTAIAVFKEITEDPTPIEEPPGEEPENYILTIKIEGQGIPTPDVGQHIIQAGERVVLSARTTDGWTFSKWIIIDETRTEEIEAQNSSIEMDSDKEITAVFEKEAPPEDNTKTLTLNIIGEGTVTLQKGYGRASIVQSGEYQFDNKDYLTFRTETTDGWEIFSWDIKSSIWNGTSYHNEEYKNFQIMDDTEITIVFSDQLHQVYLEAEYILDSLPNQNVALYATNQTWNKVKGPYIPGFEIELETYTRRGGTSGREQVHDEFRGWVVKSRETGEELPAEQYLVDPKAKETTLTMPSEAVTVTAEWVRFFRRLPNEHVFSTGIQNVEDDITKHYFDLSALDTGDQLTFQFSAVEYPSRYKVFYGTWDSVTAEQPGTLIFDSHWVSSLPNKYKDEYEDIRYPDWHEKVTRKNVSPYITGSGGVYRNLITKKTGLDYVLIIVYNKNGRYILNRSELD